VVQSNDINGILDFFVLRKNGDRPYEKSQTNKKVISAFNKKFFLLKLGL
jgi:hypothetical protein